MKVNKFITFICIFILLILTSACTSNNNNNKEIVSDKIEIIEEDSKLYIYFGSYPQSEIVSKESDSGVYNKTWESDNDYIVDETTYNKLKNLSDDNWDSNGDTTLDGNKYRRIKKDDTTYSTSNDINYYDWNDEYHYFKCEKIKWRVLKQSDNDLFLLSEIALDGKKYNTEITNMTWETSTIRSFLNGYDSSYNLYGTDYSNNNFIDTAFTSLEQEKIITTLVKNNDNEKSGTDGGNDTNDKIYLLSLDEVYGSVGELYGFENSYDAHDVSREAKSSTYAKAMGVYVETENDYIGNSFWWLRTPGSYTGLFTLVRCNGSVYRGGQHANSKSRAVRPALHISI